MKSWLRFKRQLHNFHIFLAPLLHHKNALALMNEQRKTKEETTDKEIKVQKRENWNDFSFVRASA